MKGTSQNTVYGGFSEGGQWVWGSASQSSSCECGSHSPLPKKQRLNESSAEIGADSVSQMGSTHVEIGADSVSQMGSTRVEIGADSVSQMDSTRVVLANRAPGQPDVSKPQPGTAEVFLPLGPVLTNTTQSTLTGSKFTPARPTKTVSSQVKAKPSWARGSEAGMYRRRNGTMYYKSDTGTIEERGWME